jgi:hypothetical protein
MNRTTGCDVKRTDTNGTSHEQNLSLYCLEESTTVLRYAAPPEEPKRAPSPRLRLDNFWQEVKEIVKLKLRFYVWGIPPPQWDYMIFMILSWTWRLQVHSKHWYISSSCTKDFCHGSTALFGLGLQIVQVSRSHSDTPLSVELSGRAIGPSQRPLPDNTQHSQETAFHAQVGIQTCNP